MATFTTRSRATTAVATMTGTAASREAAITAAVAAGPVGSEVHIQTCNLIGMTGPTAIYGTAWNATAPLTGATFSATSREDAVNQAVIAGPTGPSAGLDIWSVA